MCGIAGFLTFQPMDGDNPSSLLKTMTRTLTHRGPDGEGFWSDDQAVWLGHRRLSVIDLEDGRQPMISDKGNVITFNGEIYNYREIKKDLEAKGCRFKTNSDTEVLLQAFEHWGERCLEKLNGMFAFAIWVAAEKRLFVARDRLGKKPFYFYHSKTLFAFASEIKGLLSIPQIAQTAETDFRSISDYLSLGYILTPKSIYKNIQKLPAAHYGWLDMSRAEFNQRRYWNLADFYSAEKLPYTPQTVEDFQSLLSDAVSLRLRADVPLAGFLSGGVDSAAILAAMVRMDPENVTALCMGFDQTSFDESAQAKATADHIGATFEKLTHRDLSAEELDHLSWYFDEPFADTSLKPTWQLCQAAKEKVTVALSGDGADELLAGYPTYQADRLFSVFQYLPTPLQHLLKTLADKALKPSYNKVSFDYKARQFLGAAGMTPRKAHYWWRNVFSETEKQALLHPDLFDQIADYTPFDTFDRYHDDVAGASFLDQTLYVDIKTWLQDDILVKVDRMSMANGLEVRSPFLDYRLVEFAARLPDQAKINGANKKVILRQILEGTLPQETIKSPKRGFNAPVEVKSCLTADDSSGLFSSNFALNPEKEDITFKSFLLSRLNSWIMMDKNLRQQGNGQHG